jgi:hypothetical protein
VAGAVLIDETIAMAKLAGLDNINVTEKIYNLDVMVDCSDPIYRQVKEYLPEGTKISDYVISVDVTAFKK